MASYYRALSTAAGGLLTVLDELLVLNANWSIHDAAAGTNCKVYECAVTGAAFFLYVDDNQADYAKVRIYEAWDAGAHTGSGTNTSATDVRWNKVGTTAFVSLNDTRVIYAYLGTNKNYAHYAGQLKRIEEGINSPVLIGSHPSAGTGMNPIGYGATYGTETIWLICRFDTAVVRNFACVGTGTGAYVMQYRFWKADRRWYISENLVYQATELVVIGQLDGAVALGSCADTGAIHGKVVTVNGVRWIFWYDGSRGCLIKAD